MTNPHFSQITDYRDVESHNMFAELNGQGRDADELLAILASKSRDNSRTPMQWDASQHAGFTEGEPWINLCDNAAEINVAAALSDADSVFYTYQKLIALRKAEPVITGATIRICYRTAHICGVTNASGKGSGCWSLLI